MERPLCAKCKKNLAKKNYRTGGYYLNCYMCYLSPEKAKEKRSQKRVMPWTKYKKDHCENPDCKWVGPLMSCQLHVDHIDGNKKNNDPSNFQTLCACCHALKTWESGEHRPYEKRLSQMVDNA